MVAAMKAEPAAWYARHGIALPAWLEDAHRQGQAPEPLRARREAQIRSEHGANRWAHFVNMGFGTWLMTQPLLLNVTEPLLRWSEIALGALLMLLAALALSWRAQWARWACAGVGTIVMGLPFLFSTANAAAYLSDTLVGALIFGFAVCVKPDPGPSALAGSLDSVTSENETPDSVTSDHAIPDEPQHAGTERACRARPRRREPSARRR